MPIIIDTAALAREKVSSNNLMLRLALLVTEKTVAEKITSGDVGDLYDELNAEFDKQVVGHSRAAQVSKLRVFHRLGQRFGVGAVNWLRARTKRDEGLSRYETILSEARASLLAGRLT
ncbi:MAG: hypothetical protein JO223_22675 [Hyphomicrobiales bacterium]|nr:hypothetical protein [Hyphomicrobiales bacterium]